MGKSAIMMCIQQKMGKAGRGRAANEHKSSREWQRDGRKAEITKQQKAEGNCRCINIKTISASVTFMKFYELYR